MSKTYLTLTFKCNMPFSLISLTFANKATFGMADINWGQRDLVNVKSRSFLLRDICGQGEKKCEAEVISGEAKNLFWWFFPLFHLQLYIMRACTNICRAKRQTVGSLSISVLLEAEAGAQQVTHCCLSIYKVLRQKWTLTFIMHTQQKGSLFLFLEIRPAMEMMHFSH